MSVRERDFEVVVISWVEKEANFGSKKSVLLGRRRKEKKKSSDNRVISGFLFFWFRSIHIYRLLLFGCLIFVLVRSRAIPAHTERYTWFIYIYTRGKAWKSDITHC